MLSKQLRAEDQRAAVSIEDRSFRLEIELFGAEGIVWWLLQADSY
jgi:hypothetical protein